MDWLITQFNDAINMATVRRIIGSDRNVVITDTLDQIPTWSLPVGACNTQQEAELVACEIARRFAYGDNPVMFCECLDAVRSDNPRPTRRNLVEIEPQETDDPKCIRCRATLSEAEYDSSVKSRHAPYCPRCLERVR